MSKPKKLNGKDFLLLLLYAPGNKGKIAEPIKGRTRIMKMIFLFEQELLHDFKYDRQFDESKMPEFFPWNYGPFSKDVYDHIDFFSQIGFISLSNLSNEQPLSEEAEEFSFWSSDFYLEEDESNVLEYFEEIISLTELGMKFVEDKKLWDRLSNIQKDTLREFKEKFTNVPLYGILNYVYHKYPKQTTKSVIKNKILN